MVTSVTDYKNGWMIGDFDPSVVRTPSFEFAHHFHPKGFIGRSHKHVQSREFNYIVRGRLMAKDRELTAGDMFIFDKGEYSGEVTFLEDTDMVVIKTPSSPHDKYDEAGKGLGVGE